MEIRSVLHKVLSEKVSIAPLVTFRVLFGLIMLFSIIRFWSNGWIEAQYIDPQFHFKYFGFYWLPELSAAGYYAAFALIAASAVGIALGAFYRISAIVFFLAFTYVEMMDATYYLNHYYFVSIVGFLLIFMPANKAVSLDSKFGFTKPESNVAAWSIYLIKFQLALVYFMAGLAKLNYYWLIEAQPLAIWLPAQDHLPLVGWLFQYKATAYLFSWAGALYDLTIPFLLIYKPTRWLAYLAVIAFHVLTYVMFQIGMFPFIMIGATLIFFSGNFHQKLWQTFGFSFTLPRNEIPVLVPAFAKIGLAVFVGLQLILPFRFALYPGSVYWHEQGYRFGWRVMLMEKAGYAQFKVIDKNGRSIEVNNAEFLTPVQEKMMSTQSDFMLQYANFIKAHYQIQGIEVAAVNADVFVTLNGRGSQRYIDPSIDLSSIDDSFSNKTWILPMKNQGSI